LIYVYKVWLPFDARLCVKKWCQTLYRAVSVLNNPMPCPASFFDAMSGIIKLTISIPVVTYTALACDPSFVEDACQNSASFVGSCHVFYSHPYSSRLVSKWHVLNKILSSLFLQVSLKKLYRNAMIKIFQLFCVTRKKNISKSHNFIFWWYTLIKSTVSRSLVQNFHQP